LDGCGLRGLQQTNTGRTDRHCQQQAEYGVAAQSNADKNDKQVDKNDKQVDKNDKQVENTHRARTWCQADNVQHHTIGLSRPRKTAESQNAVVAIHIHVSP
jgi:hypothetical protein